MKNNLIKTTLTALALALIFLCVGAGVSPSLAAQPVVIRHPQDGYASIQDAVDAAGCGGTVRLAAGTYHERVLADCGIHLIGEGVDQTVLDATGLHDLAFMPVIGLGQPPIAIFPMTEGYEVAHLSIIASPEQPAMGLATGWTRDVSLHHLRITGFRTGLTVANSLDTTISHVSVQGLGAAQLPDGGLSFCLDFGTPRFRKALPDGHMHNHIVEHVTAEDCFVGINFNNIVNGEIHHNTTRRTFIGINLNAVGDSEIHHNLVEDSDTPFDIPAAGMDLANANSLDIHHNTYCGNTLAVRYNFSFLPTQLGFPPSSNNFIHQNTFGLNDQDVVYDDPNIGPDNTESNNLSDPGACS